MISPRRARRAGWPGRARAFWACEPCPCPFSKSQQSSCAFWSPVLPSGTRCQQGRQKVGVKWSQRRTFVRVSVVTLFGLLELDLAPSAGSARIGLKRRQSLTRQRRVSQPGLRTHCLPSTREGGARARVFTKVFTMILDNSPQARPERAASRETGMRTRRQSVERTHLSRSAGHRAPLPLRYWLLRASCGAAWVRQR